MIIELPKKFERTYEDYGYARINNGILELKGRFNFEKIMVELAYRMKGKKRCYYCRKTVNPKKITIDHLFPSDFGGVTITNNLEPACHSCNSSKSNMNQYEFNIWRTLETAEQKKRYYHKVVEKKRRTKYNPKLKKSFDLPKAWIEYMPLSRIKKVTSVNNRDGQKFKRMMTYSRRNQKLPRPIIVSSNYILLDGETAFAVAKELKFEEVPVIKLENVIVLK